MTTGKKGREKRKENEISELHIRFVWNFGRYPYG